MRSLIPLRIISGEEAVQKDLLNRKVGKTGAKGTKINSYIPAICYLYEKAWRSSRLICSDFFGQHLLPTFKDGPVIPMRSEESLTPK